jgi:hypothetical protein
VRADLAAEYHEDLVELWAARRWRHLIELVSQLPQTSRLTDALVNDPDYAQGVVDVLDYRDPDSDDADETSGPSSVRGETPEVQVLRDVYDLLLGIVGGKGKYPRPITAVDRIRQSRAESDALDIIAILTPWAIDN